MEQKMQLSRKWGWGGWSKQEAVINVLGSGLLTIKTLILHIWISPTLFKEKFHLYLHITPAHACP